MKRGYMVDPLKMVVCLLTGIGLELISALFLSMGKILPVVLFFAMGILYLAISTLNAMIVRWDAHGVSRNLFGRQIHCFSWEEVSEVGVIGTKVFNRGNPSHTGRLYLYFSKEKTSEDERFQMILHWPPRDKIYLLYQADRFEHLRTVYSGEVETFNEGDLIL